MKHLSGDAKFLFFTMMQCALKFRELDQNKGKFLIFANEIWDTMLLNNEDTLRDTLQSAMMKDIKDYVNK